MPELPEVETVTRGLAEMLQGQPAITEIKVVRADLRAPVPVKALKHLSGSQILGVRRRAKYILIDLNRATLISHLGMTGSWRMAPKGDERDHDHIYLHLSSGERLAFRDPRRFGLFTCVGKGEEASWPGIASLGPEPLAPEMNSRALSERAQGRSVAIKVFLMDQKNVVGVGNIYASEALFRAGVDPRLRAGSIREQEWHRIVSSIREVLSEAIEKGGTTLRDFRQAGGSEGYFQMALNVYDRGDELCRVCATKIRMMSLGGRSTYWCPSCQPKSPQGRGR